MWYISIPKNIKNATDICVEWYINSGNKTECIDQDGNESNELYSFPILTELSDTIEFSLKNNTDWIDDITVYSMNTKPMQYSWNFALPKLNANNTIISRKEWWADETMRYADSVHWKSKWPAYLEYIKSPKTQAQLDAIKLDDERTNYLIQNGWDSNKIVSVIRYENGRPLVMPIEKVKQVSRIVLHHTAESLDTNAEDEELIRGIYVYHTLSRQWWDIGYNYLVWQRWKIYEWRAWWDYVVSAHAAYNNMGTVWVSVLWNYSKNNLNRDQIAWLESIIVSLAQKYWITLSDNKKWVKRCDKLGCRLFETVTTKSLLGHTDVGFTDCPGDDIHDRISDMIQRLNRSYKPVLNPINWPIQPLPRDLVLNRELKTVVTEIPSTSPTIAPIKSVRYIGQKFRVKLSYPDATNIVLATADGFAGKLFIDKKKTVLPVSQKIKISVLWEDKLGIIVGNKFYSGSELKLSHSVVRIDSWSRIPDWDKSWRYNDNVFRDTIRVINQKWRILVINDLPLEWYLKWLWEVSNGDLNEKIKTIIVAARTYARYYMDPKNRKFATRLYDGSDNPDEFQKYLGYSYEMRSPNVSKLVDATRSEVITYKNTIIKAWYHSSSNGRTLSYVQYCTQNGWKNCTDIPYLQSIADPWSVNNNRSGHGVGISGIGATYWARENWNYKQIIQYYLHWVEIQKK